MKITSPIAPMLLVVLGLVHDLGIHQYGEQVTGRVVVEKKRECDIRLDDGRHFKLTSRNCERTNGRYVLFMGRLRLDNASGRYSGTVMAGIVLLLTGTVMAARQTTKPSEYDR